MLQSSLALQVVAMMLVEASRCVHSAGVDNVGGGVGPSGPTCCEGGVSAGVVGAPASAAARAGRSSSSGAIFPPHAVAVTNRIHDVRIEETHGRGEALPSRAFRFTPVSLAPYVSAPMPLRALVVSYNFPPVGGAGVQRVLKLVKYLPAHDVTPRVLTVSNPSVPVLDATLERDFPEGLVVTRARTFEPGYGAKKAAWEAKSAQGASSAAGATSFAKTVRRRVTKGLSDAARQLLFPDPQLLWQPAAQIAMARELVRERPDVVFVSGPPFSQFLLAPLVRTLGRSTAIVLDYRDEWSTYRSSYEMMGSRIGALVGDPLEEGLLKIAHAVTIATNEFREALLSRFSFVDPARVHAIPNGYDPDDFPADRPDPPRDRLVISYAGTVFRLTSVRGFMEGVRLFHERAPALAQRVSIRFMGRIVETEADTFVGSESLGVEQKGYLPHDDVIRALAASHVNLCVLDDVPGAERIYPAKIFELMALGRPVLTLAPTGALSRLVEEERLGPVLPPRDAAQIAAHLERLAQEFASTGRIAAAGAGVAHERYSRRALAGEFADVFREAVARAR